MDRSDIDRLLMAIAVHEAGHALACYLYKIPMTRVVLSNKGELGGYVSLSIRDAKKRLDSEWREGRRRNLAERIIKCALAGGIAQKKYATKLYKPEDAEADGEIAFPIAAKESGSMAEASGWCRLLQIQVRQEISLPNNWQAILAVARELYVQKSLSAARARVLLKESAG